MKDSNFDSIKEKFDNSGVNAPDAINEEMILEKLGEQRPLTLLPPKKKKKKPVVGVSVAAAVAVITAGAVTLTSVLNKPPVRQQAAVQAKLPEGLRSFKTRSEIIETLDGLKKLNTFSQYVYEDERGAEDSASSSGSFSDGCYSGSAEDSYNGSSGGSSNGSSSGSAGIVNGANGFSGSGLPDASSHNSTYVQSTGVDEGDTVKTTDKYIFYSSRKLYGYSPSVDVFTADGKNTKKAAEINISNDADRIIDFYVLGDRLVVLCGSYAELSPPDENGRVKKESDVYVGNRRAVTEACVYDFSDIGNIKKVSSFSQSGDYVSSRMIGAMLYLVTCDNAYSAYDGDYCLPVAGGDSCRELAPGDICAVERPASDTFMVVSGINIDEGSRATKTRAILGSADIVYCNTENLYVTAYNYAEAVYNAMFDTADDETYSYSDMPVPDETRIIKISLNKDIDFTADGTVAGMVNNQYSLDEYKGNLRVATTSYDSDNETVNNLFILDGNLNLIGQANDIAKGESIKAVRYINEIAYVITYEQTDPLFVIDSSDPAAPKVLGEVKISGFSTMLVPVDDNTLLGIGYHTEESDDDGFDMEIQEGLKLVTFDISDKSSPKVLDEKIYIDYYSEVQSNPKTLLVNFERGDYSIPMQYYHFDMSDYDEDTYEWSTDDWDSYYEAHTSAKSGLLNFRVDNGKIVVTDDYTSAVFDGSKSIADRCVYVGENQYLLGERGGMTDEPSSSAIECVPYK